MSSCEIYLSSIAIKEKRRPAVLKCSFDKFRKTFPDVDDHVELVEETTLGGFGGRCLTYRMDPLALAAFMYWREHHGRLPRIFGVERRVVEGSVNEKP